MADINPFVVERPWGAFRQFTKNSASTVKIITVKPGEKLSLQSHTKRAEFWRVLRGSGVVEVDGKKTEMMEGHECEIPLGSKHRLEAGDMGIEVLEIATGEALEEDIIRYEDKYGRA